MYNDPYILLRYSPSGIGRLGELPLNGEPDLGAVSMSFGLPTRKLTQRVDRHPIPFRLGESEQIDVAKAIQAIGANYEAMMMLVDKRPNLTNGSLHRGLAGAVESIADVVRNTGGDLAPVQVAVVEARDVLNGKYAPDTHSLRDI